MYASQLPAASDKPKGIGSLMHVVADYTNEEGNRFAEGTVLALETEERSTLNSALPLWELIIE